MSKKLKKIIAIIALVFMALFTVSLILTFYDRTLFNGAIGFFTLFTGGVGIALFFTIKLSRSPEDYEQQEGKEDENGEEKTDANEQKED